jgi:hypothetical protein
MTATELLEIIATNIFEVEIRGGAIAPDDAASVVGWTMDLLTKYGPEILPDFNFDMETSND